MAKKNNEKIVALNTASEVMDLFTKHENVSLRKVALETNATYSLLLKASKKPVVGEAYNPEAINWDEVAKYFNKREIKLADLDWDALNEVTARGGNGKLSKSTDEYNVGDICYLRDKATIPYTVIYKTETHIVVLAADTTEPRALKNSTFILMGAQKTPRTEKVEAEVEVEEQ